MVESVRILELERLDPGDGHSFWQLTAELCGVVIVFHDRFDQWVTDDFTTGRPHDASGWLGDVLDMAVLRHEMRGGSG